MLTRDSPIMMVSAIGQESEDFDLRREPRAAASSRAEKQDGRDHCHWRKPRPITRRAVNVDTGEGRARHLDSVDPGDLGRDRIQQRPAHKQVPHGQRQHALPPDQ